jgi:hypothetical protein
VSCRAKLVSVGSGMLPVWPNESSVMRHILILHFFFISLVVVRLMYALFKTQLINQLTYAINWVN